MKINPTVTIAIPAYNGGKYIGKAIESVLNQTFSDFRLVICDDRSKDNTQDICQSFKDNRIEYYRNKKNLGIAGNYNLCFRKNTSPYFKWLSQDDLIAPTFLEKCLEILQNNPELSIVHSKTLKIDKDDRIFGNYDSQIHLNFSKTSERFRRLLWMDFIPEFHGLMRTDVIRKTRLIDSFSGADRNFVGHITLLGNVEYVEEYLFKYRIHSDNYSISKKTYLERLLSFNPNLKGAKLKAKLTSFYKWESYVYAITHSQLPKSEQIVCFMYLMEWFLGRIYEEILAREKFQYYGKYRIKVMEHYGVWKSK